MINIIDQTINILTTSPGNLFYHLILIFSIVMSIQARFALKQWLPKPDSTRLLVGLIFLLVMQIGLFLFGSMIWQGLLTNGRTYFPPIDRAILSLEFIWIAWLWIFHKPSRAADIINLLLNIGVITLAFFTIRAWSIQEATVFFNSTILDWSWLVFTTIILVSVILLILTRRPKSWGAALVFFNLNLIACLAHMLWATPNSDFSAAFRFTLILSFPLLPITIYRFNQPRDVPSAIKKLDQPTPQNDDEIWSNIFKKNTPSEFIAEISKLSTVKTSSKFCLFQEDGDYTEVIRLLGGFDGMRGHYIVPISLKAKDFRAIVKSLDRPKPTIIEKNALTQSEFTKLSDRLEIVEEIYQWLIYPIGGEEENKRGALILGSNTTEPEWSNNASRYLDAINPLIIEKLKQFNEIEDLKVENETLQQEVSATYHKLQRIQNEIVNQKMHQKDLPSLVAIQEEAQKRIDELITENQLLTLKLKDFITSGEQEAAEQNGEEMVNVIDSVIDQVSSKLLDRSLTLQLNLPEDSTVMVSQSSLLEKALTHLFIYATEISHDEGIVNFTVIEPGYLNQQNQTEFILNTVSGVSSKNNKNLTFCEAYISALGGLLAINETVGNQTTIRIVLPL